MKLSVEILTRTRQGTVLCLWVLAQRSCGYTGGARLHFLSQPREKIEVRRHINWRRQRSPALHLDYSSPTVYKKYGIGKSLSHIFG